MQMFSGHTVGQLMYVAQNYGFFFLLLNVTLYLIGMFRTYCSSSICAFTKLVDCDLILEYCAYFYLARGVDNQQNSKKVILFKGM